MSIRELVVLGTSSQVPTRHRNHGGYLLLWDGEGLLFDPGEGSQRQMIQAGVSATDITRILITHFHGDHCLGLAGLVQRISLDRVPQVIPVHFPASGQCYYDRLRQASIFRDEARLEPRPIHGPGCLDPGPPLRLEARTLDHPVETYGFRLVEPDGVTMLPELLTAAGVEGPAVRQLQEQGELEVAGRTVRLEEVSRPRRGQVVAFIMDTRPCPGMVELALDADLLICEATYTGEHEREAREYHHLTAAQAAELAREARVRQLVLTHLSSRYPDPEPVRFEAAAIHPEVLVAMDGDRVPLPPRRR